MVRLLASTQIMQVRFLSFAPVFRELAIVLSPATRRQSVGYRVLRKRCNGGCSSIGRAPGCDPGRCEIMARRSPQFCAQAERISTRLISERNSVRYRSAQPAVLWLSWEWHSPHKGENSGSTPDSTTTIFCNLNLR